MFNVFITEASTVFAHCKSHSMARWLVVCARVFRVEGLDWEAALYADWHFIDMSRLPIFEDRGVCIGSSGSIVSIRKAAFAKHLGVDAFRARAQKYILGNLATSNLTSPRVLLRSISNLCDCRNHSMRNGFTFRMNGYEWNCSFVWTKSLQPQQKSTSFSDHLSEELERLLNVGGIL